MLEEHEEGSKVKNRHKISFCSCFASLAMALLASGCNEQGRAKTAGLAKTMADAARVFGECPTGLTYDPTQRRCVSCPAGRCLFDARSVSLPRGTSAAPCSSGWRPPPHPQLPGVVEADLDPKGRVTGIELDESTKIRSSEFRERYGAVFGLGPFDSIVESPLPDGPNEYQNVALEQLHRGVPVANAAGSLSLHDGFVTSARGEFERNLDLSVVPLVPPSRAVEIAKKAAPALHPFSGAQVIESTPPHLLIVNRKLSWRVLLETESSHGPHYVCIVDASVGKLVSLDDTALD